MDDRREFVYKFAAALAALGLGSKVRFVKKSDGRMMEHEFRVREHMGQDEPHVLRTELPAYLSDTDAWRELGYEPEDLLAAVHRQHILNLQVHARRAFREGFTREQAQEIVNSYRYGSYRARPNLSGLPRDIRRVVEDHLK